MESSVSRLNPAHDDFAAEIHGLNLAEPASGQMTSQFVAAMDRFAVCVVRGQRITDDQHVEFSQLLGEPEPVPLFGAKQGSARRLRHPQLFDISNLDQDGALLAEDDRRRQFRLANEAWHTDSSYRAGGASYSILAAHVVPAEGADTEFADLRAAYDALDPDLRASLDGLVAEHSIEYSRSVMGYRFDPTEKEMRPPARQYLVQTNRRTGRRSLYLASYASHIVGRDVEEGRALIQRLMAFATQPRFIYRHRWKDGDVLAWDNRCTMHRATPFKALTEPRDLRRTTLFGDLPLVSP